MSPVRFDASREEMHLILMLANRAVNEFGDYSKLNAMMDINAAHMNGCKLHLDALLHAPIESFMHDIGGIRARLDRDTGKLPADWTPRYCLERT